MAKKITQLPTLAQGDINENLVVIGDQDGVSSQILGSGLRMAIAKRTLTSPEILALFTTPITIVPAPGVGKAIVPVSLAVKLVFDSIAYTIEDNINFDWDGSVKLIVPLGGMLDATADKYALLSNIGASAITDVVENKAVTVFAPNANPETGNSTVKIGFQYWVFDFLS